MSRSGEAEAGPPAPWTDDAFMRKVFAEADANGDGTLDQQEVVNFAQKLRPERYILPADAAKLMAELDADGDGRVTYDEFAGWWVAGHGSLTAFEAFDLRWNNVKSSFDTAINGALGQAACELGAPLPRQAAEARTPADSEERGRWQAQLGSTGYLEPSCPRFWHGRAFQLAPAGGGSGSGGGGSGQPQPVPLPLPPKATWRSKQKPRKDHEGVASWLTASEFADGEAALDIKLGKLCELLKLSKKTVVYSGAGLSVAAGIGQAARGAARGGKSSDAAPTVAHFALGELHRAGLLHGWVQQNHDGLPQKGGFPQEDINEIHGSWFDPSNPVVKYSGSLKADCYPKMRAAAESADLVLVIGTTLGGLNADQVATSPAWRSTRDTMWDGTGRGGALGTVIINLQQTEQDGKATLRLFGKADDVLAKLVGRLGLPWRPPHRMPDGGTHPGPTPAWLKPPRMPLAVPYDSSSGARTADGTTTQLDLRPGQAVRLCDGHNVQGARQPKFMHIGAKPGSTAANGRKAGRGVGVVKAYDPVTSAYVLEIEGVRMLLGGWWAHAAARGGVEQLPVVNER